MKPIKLITDKKGFTLIEIIVVVIIVGVLATFAITNFNHWIEASRSAEVLPVLHNLADQISTCNAKYGSNINTILTSCTLSIFPALGTTNQVYPAAYTTHFNIFAGEQAWFNWNSNPTMPAYSTALVTVRNSVDYNSAQTSETVICNNQPPGAPGQMLQQDNVSAYGGIIAMFVTFVQGHPELTQYCIVGSGNFSGITP